MPLAVRYALAPLLVAAATVLAYACQYGGVQPQGLTLVYVVPVVAAAAQLGFGPALVTAVGAVLTLDFLFLPPLYSLEISSPSDIAGIVLLAIVATIVSAVAAQSLRRSLEARAAAERAEALRTLAHAVVHGAAEATLFQSAAEALAQIFKAPAAIFLETDGAISTAAKAGGAGPARPDREAAQWAASHGTHVQGGVYPFGEARFDMWPVDAASDQKIVLGVDFSTGDAGRPGGLETVTDLVAGYLAAALDRRAPA